MTTPNTSSIILFQDFLPLIQQNIKAHKAELTKSTPQAKNKEFQEEIAQIFSIYHKVLEQDIAALTQEETMLQRTASLIDDIISSQQNNPSASTMQSSNYDSAKALTTIQDLTAEFNMLEAGHAKNTCMLQTLKERVTHLKREKTPAPLPANWWDQFGTSLGSSS